MTDLLYQLTNLTQSYGDRVVLNIEQLDIAAGEILAIVGPSGAGKSTLLRLLNFLEQPTAGDVRFEDVNINGRGAPLETRRSVTMVFQQPLLLNRTVEANVAYGLQIRGQDRREAAPAVEQILDRVGLTRLAKEAARNLSGGEAQRVALARALVVQPSVLLLDEPTANLDPYNVKLIEQIIEQVNQEWGTTVVLVTHNIFQARRMAHRTALLLDGQLVEIAQTETFFSTPSDPRTSAFVQGDMVY